MRNIGKVLPLVLSRDGLPLVVQGRHVVAIDDGNSYLAAGIAGLGVLWLPHYMAHAPLARGELLTLFDGWNAGRMPLHLLFPPGRHMSVRLRVFVRWLGELLVRHAPLSAWGLGTAGLASWGGWRAPSSESSRVDGRPSRSHFAIHASSRAKFPAFNGAPNHFSHKLIFPVSGVKASRMGWSKQALQYLSHR